MTWEELVEKAKELNYKEWGNPLEGYRCRFFKSGETQIRDMDYDCFALVSEDRTPEQMYQIMKGLEG